MTVATRIYLDRADVARVSERLKRLQPKLRQSIERGMETKAQKWVIKELKEEMDDYKMVRSLAKIVKPNRKQKKTEKPLETAILEAQRDLIKSIGRRKLSKWRMRNKLIVYGIVGPRSGFKIRGKTTKKRQLAAASTVAELVERGTEKAPANPYTRRVYDRAGPHYERVMMEAARDLLNKAKAP